MAALSENARISTVSQSLRQRTRLAIAIIISALIHLGLAGEVTVHTPGHAVRGPVIISARLEIPVTPQAAPSPNQDDAKEMHEAAPDLRRRNRPADNEQMSSGGSPTLRQAMLEKTQNARVNASALPSDSDPVYYSAHQLDVYPALVQPVNLDYPRDAGDGHASGRVLLMLLIDETGVVRELSIADAGPARAYENLVRAAFSDARFYPARKAGRVVKSRVLIGVDYRP